MSLFALDTDVLTLFQEGHPIVCQRAGQEPENSVAVTVLSIEEQLSGWYTQLRQAKHPDRLAWAYRRLAETVRFFSHLQILDFNEAAIRRCEDLRKRKLRLGRFDLRIAATALECGAIVVSRNTRDFRRVPELSVEDWSQ